MNRENPIHHGGQVQGELFNKGLDERFAVWVHTPAGGEIAGQFIRASCGLKLAGWKRYGAKRVVEGIRWNVHLQHGPGADGYKINNNLVSRLARFAESRAPELQGFFEKRVLRH